MIYFFQINQTQKALIAITEKKMCNVIPDDRSTPSEELWLWVAFQCTFSRRSEMFKFRVVWNAASVWRLDLGHRHANTFRPPIKLSCVFGLSIFMGKGNMFKLVNFLWTNSPNCTAAYWYFNWGSRPVNYKLLYSSGSLREPLLI